MHFHATTLLSLSAAFFASTAFASAAPNDLVEAPTKASVHELAARTSIPPGCWSGTAFPPKAAWSPFPTAFEVAKGGMKYGNDTKTEIKAIHNAILDVAKKSGIDSRFILAIMRRESDGATTIPCNDNGRSCGVMQCHGTNVPHCKRHPCPSKDIHRMIKCGVLGCGKGASSISECASRYGHNWGELARCYNTGSVPNPNDYTQATYGVRTYVQDVGNLLLAADFPTWDSFDHGKCGFVNS